MHAPIQGSVKPQFNNLVIKYFARIGSVLQNNYCIYTFLDKKGLGSSVFSQLSALPVVS
jgi:hypothetical protein